MPEVAHRGRREPEVDALDEAVDRRDREAVAARTPPRRRRSPSRSGRRARRGGRGSRRSARTRSGRAAVGRRSQGYGDHEHVRAQHDRRGHQRARAADRGERQHPDRIPGHEPGGRESTESVAHPAGERPRRAGRPARVHARCSRYTSTTASAATSTARVKWTIESGSPPVIAPIPSASFCGTLQRRRALLVLADQDERLERLPSERRKRAGRNRGDGRERAEQKARAVARRRSA